MLAAAELNTQDFEYAPFRISDAFCGVNRLKGSFQTSNLLESVVPEATAEYLHVVRFCPSLALVASHKVYRLYHLAVLTFIPKQ